MMMVQIACDDAVNVTVPNNLGDLRKLRFFEAGGNLEYVHTRRGIRDATSDVSS